MPRWMHVLLLLAFLQGVRVAFTDEASAGASGLFCVAAWAFNVFAFRRELFGEAR